MIFRKFSLLLAFLLLVLGGGYTFAESNIWEITVHFCNDAIPTTQLSMVADAGKSYDVCVEFTNNSITDTMVKAGFIDGTITEDALRDKACQNEWDITRFGQYLTFDTKPFFLAAGTTITKRAIMKFPSGYNGLIYGCLTYYISKTNDVIANGNSMFNVLVRKANFINVLLGGKLERNLVDTIGWIQNIAPRIDPATKHLVAEIPFQNKGNVIENVTFSGSISNVFGYYRAITWDVLKILWEDKWTLMIDMWTIPFYKWLYTVDISVVSTPKVDFAVEIPATMKEPIVLHKTFTVFFVPYLIIALLIVLILIIRMIKRFFSKFHLVAVAPTTPVK